MMQIMLRQILIYVSTFAVIYGNECAWPAGWRPPGKKAWLTSMEKPNSTVGNIITYQLDKSAFTARTTDPTKYIDTYNCQAYSSASDGTQYYLRVPNSRQENNNGMCVAQRLHHNVLVRREGGVQPSISVCQEEIRKVKLYDIFVPVEPQKPSLRATWSVNTVVPCPMQGRHKIACTLPGNVACSQDNELSGQENYTTIFIENIKYSQPDLPLTGELHCLADMTADVIGEPATNDRILIVRSVTNYHSDMVRIYCVRYRRLNDGTVSMSFDIDSRSHLQCMMGAKHDWEGQHGGRNYFRISLIPQHHHSTLVPPGTQTALPTTSTTTTTTTTAAPISLFHIQMVIDDKYADNTGNEDQMKSDLEMSLGNTCGIETRRIRQVHLEEGKGGATMVTYDVTQGTPSVQECKDNLEDRLNSRSPIHHGDKESQLSENIYLWKDGSMCPDTACNSGSKCWIRQGDYSCECFTEDNALQRCPGAATAADDSISNNQIIIFSVVAVAGVLVIIAIIVIIIVVRRRRAEGKDDNASDQDSIPGSLEQLDRDMYSSIGKKPTAYHDKSFIVDDDEGYGEKTGIHGAGYM